MTDSTIRGTQTFRDVVTFTKAPVVPNSSFGNSDIKNDPNNLIEATKGEHQFSVDKQLFESATTIAAVTELMHIVNGATGEVVALEAVMMTVADDASRTVTIQLEKSTAGGAFASILTTPITFTSTDTARTAEAAVISSEDLVDGDILQVVVTVAGGAGNQALGLLVSLSMREDP